MLSALMNALPEGWVILGGDLLQANGTYKASGLEAQYFVARGGGIGFKIYGDEPSRDRAMGFQIQAAREGLGPLVYGSFRAIRRNYEWFGYITEHVKLWEYEADILPFHRELRERFLKVFGVPFTDAHKGNIGYRGEGADIQPLVIDFGDCSF